MLTNSFSCYVFLVACVLPLVGCQQAAPTQQLSTAPPYQLRFVPHSHNQLIETTLFTGVLFNRTTEPAPRTFIEAFTPTPAEIFLAETILRRCVGEEPVGWQKPVVALGGLFPLTQYYRQYFGYQTPDEHKIIWINAFRRPENSTDIPLAWQQRKRGVEDGGNNYFPVSIHLSTNECTDFVRNSISP